MLLITFHWISAAYFWLQNFNKKLIKERNWLEIFVKERCFEKNCFDDKKCKDISFVKDQPMFRNMIKTICCWRGLKTWNLIDVVRKFALSNAFFLTNWHVQGLNKIISLLHQVRVIFKNFISDLSIAATNVRGTYFILNDST